MKTNNNVGRIFTPLSFCLFLFSCFVFFSCEAPEQWHEAKDTVAPGDVKMVRVENINGGARILYTLPTDNDLLGAKVCYSLTEGGGELERYCSAHFDGFDTEGYGEVDTLEIEGYGHTGKRTVTVFAVDKSENLSKGITVEIEPDVPAIDMMRSTLVTSSTFGGVKTEWKNKMGKDMAISLYTPDSITGEPILFDTYFSNDSVGKYVFRSFESVPTNFHIEMKDRWDNYSEPLDTTITPLFEERIWGKIDNVNIWSHLGLDDDTWADRGDLNNKPLLWVVNAYTWILWDNVVRPNNNQGNPPGWAYHGWSFTMADWIPGSTSPTSWPLYLTIDMGRKSILSRFNFTNRLRDPTYSADIPIDFEIWGTNDPKPVTPGDRIGNLNYWTSWSEVEGTNAWQNDWVKLANCKLVLSSGESKYRAGMALSADDVERSTTERGWDFDMDEGVTMPFRYIRFVIKDTNTGAKMFSLVEFRFWGAYSD
jgi:hypothetical protein